MLSFHEIMKVQYCSTRIRVEPKLVNSKLPKVKQAIIDYFKKDQMDMPGAPNDNFQKISVRKTISELEFSEHLL